MKLIASLVSVLICTNVFATTNGFERGAYVCSNGQAYDVATYYSSSLGSPTRWFVALCKLNTMTGMFYRGSGNDEPLEIKNCSEQISKELVYCQDEFLLNNPTDEDGLFTDSVYRADINKATHGGVYKEP